MTDALQFLLRKEQNYIEICENNQLIKQICNETYQ